MQPRRCWVMLVMLMCVSGCASIRTSNGMELEEGRGLVLLYMQSSYPFPLGFSSTLRRETEWFDVQGGASGYYWLLTMPAGHYYMFPSRERMTRTMVRVYPKVEFMVRSGAVNYIGDFYFRPDWYGVRRNIDAAKDHLKHHYGDGSESIPFVDRTAR